MWLSYTVCALKLSKSWSLGPGLWIKGNILSTFKTSSLHACVSVRGQEGSQKSERNILRWREMQGEPLTASCLQNGHKPSVLSYNFKNFRHIYSGCSQL